MAWFRAAWPWLAVGVTALVMHHVVGPAAGPFYAKVLMDCGIAILLAVSLNIVNGLTGQFSIGHAGFMAVGGYVAGWTTYYGGALGWGGFPGSVVPGADGHLLFLAATVLGGLAAAATGLVVGLPSLRLRGDYLAIVTLGFGEIVRVLITRTEDVLSDPQAIADATMGGRLLAVGGSLGFTGLPFYTSMFWTWAWVGITLVTAFRLKESSVGRAWLSIREDEVASEAMGVDTTTLKVRAFVVAAFFAGVAGSLFAHEIGTTLNPAELGFQKSFEIVIMVVLGGMGSVSGATLAAVVLTILPEALREFSEYRMIAYALTLVLVMLVRPGGLLGTHEIWHLRRRR